jgi:hypothetical protein
MVRNLKLSIVLFALAAFANPLPGSAGTLFHHPRYLHARTDLRAAQYFLRVHDEPNVMHHVRAVDSHIEAAIHEIDHAAVIDHKDIEDHPHIDTNVDRPGRFRKVKALLLSARKDIGEEEDNPRAIGWRDVAYRHIDEALRQLHEAARDLHFDHIDDY